MARAEAALAQPGPDTSQLSDGYHTFADLYEHRHALCLALMRAMPQQWWFSRRHDDGGPCFGGDDWFIVGADLPGLDDPSVTYHLPMRLWEVAQATGAKELPKGRPWDGHSAQDVVDRFMLWAALKDQPCPMKHPVWTEGVCGDGAAILKDGVMQPIEDVIAALNAAELAQPEPVAPNHAEICQWLSGQAHWGADADYSTARVANLVQYAIAHFCRPAIAPISVSERKPEEKDCTTDRGECWHWWQGAECWELIRPPENYYVFDEWTHWLPHWALPIPQQDPENK
jgi:hypothetical protein